MTAVDVFDRERELLEGEAEVRREFDAAAAAIARKQARREEIAKLIVDGARDAGFRAASFNSTALEDEDAQLARELRVDEPALEGIRIRLGRTGEPIRQMAHENRGEYVQAARQATRDLEPLAETAAAALADLLDAINGARARWLHAWRGLPGEDGRTTFVSERMGGITPIDTRMPDRAPLDIRKRPVELNLHARAKGPTATTILEAALAALRDLDMTPQALRPIDIARQRAGGHYVDLLDGRPVDVEPTQIRGGNGWQPDPNIVARCLPDEWGCVRYRWVAPWESDHQDWHLDVSPDEHEQGVKYNAATGGYDVDPRHNRELFEAIGEAEAEEFSHLHTIEDGEEPSA
ncbi:MAG TPA: hypothetical protein VHX66_00275 [Solirubrobacteraceae bacterium]|jgi:hypothetical protein|nr:hypothetical protein [Solirubrobacteraceae bacterium]